MKSFEVDEPKKSLYPDHTQEYKPLQTKSDHSETCSTIGFLFLLAFMIFLGGFVPISTIISPNILKIVSMDFIAELNNNNTAKQSHHIPLVSARWDLLIRVPGILVGDYICLQGSLQASFLYNKTTLVSSSIQSYSILESGMPQIFKVSAVATENDLNGAIGKEIMEAIKERSVVRFGSRVSLTDCREETEKGTVTFECDETTLRFEPDSGHIKATAIRNHSTCTVNV